jgi:hypothetical protein
MALAHTGLGQQKQRILKPLPSRGQRQRRRIRKIIVPAHHELIKGKILAQQTPVMRTAAKMRQRQLAVVLGSGAGQRFGRRHLDHQTARHPRYLRQLGFKQWPVMIENPLFRKKVGRQQHHVPFLTPRHLQRVNPHPETVAGKTGLYRRFNLFPDRFHSTFLCMFSAYDPRCVQHKQI